MAELLGQVLNNPDLTVELGPWPIGMDNRQPEYALDEHTLRNAVNVDLDNSGRARSRAGITRVYAGHDIHSVFSCENGVFFVEAGAIKKLAANRQSATTVKSGVIGKVAFCCAPDADGTLSVYFSDSSKTTGKIKASGAVKPWGIPAPSAPNMYGTGGTLPKGWYTAYCTATLDGEESGASPTVQVYNANDNCGVTITAPHVTGATGANIYVTTPNGSMFYRAATGFSATVTTIPTGKGLYPEVVSPPPTGQFIRNFCGRLYIASGNVLWYTEPFQYGRVKLQYNYILFPDRITVLEPVSEGIWCVADKAYWISGTNPKEFTLNPQLDYGAIEGTGLPVPNTNDVMWMSVRGAVFGDQSGNCTNLQEDHVAIIPGSTGAAIIREQDGLRQFIASFNPEGKSALQAGAWMDAEVIRKGT